MSSPARGSDPTASTEATPTGAAAVTAPGATATPGARGGTPQQQATAGGGGRGGYNWCNNGGKDGGFGRGGGQGSAVPALDPTRSGVFRSDDKGGSWTLVSNCNARPMYFSQIRVDPSNDKTIYVAGLPVAKSLDGGKTFVTLDEAGGHGSPGHVDQHAIWIDPRNPKHILIGNDGGLNITWDQGKTWDYVNTMATSLSYWVSADMRRPYFVYTGLQDNGSWGGPSATRSANGILNSDWFGIGGGDGFQTAVDPSDFNSSTRESQDGNTNRTICAARTFGQYSAAGPGDEDAEVRRGCRGTATAHRCQGWHGAGCVPPGEQGPSRRRHAAAASSGRVRWPRWPAECAERRVRPMRIASTGTRRSCCRPTTRASCGWAATGSSSRTTGATRGWRVPISPRASIATRWRSWARQGTAPSSRRTMASSRTARSSRSRNLPSCQASSGLDDDGNGR